MSCCGKGKYPGIHSMAKDLSVTVMRALREAVKTGKVLAPEHDVRKRLETCNLCEYKTGVRCSKCGCYISLKTAVLAAKCPIQKW